MEKQKNNNTFNKGLVIFAWILIALGVIFTIRYYIFSNKFISTNNAQVEQYITPVSSKVPGFIREIMFQENQYVHKGDTLVILDNQEYANKVSMAQSDVATLNDDIAINQTEVNAQNGNVKIQKSRLDAAKILVWKTQKDYLRFKNLVEEDAATEQQFEQVKAAYDVAVAQLNTIQEEQSAALLKSTALSAKTQPVKSSIKNKEANLGNAALYLSYTVITAPYDGWVGKKTIQIGQLVKEGQTLANVVSKEKWVTANFRETQIAPLKVGTSIIITADAYPDLHFEGKISSFSPASGSKFSLLPQDNSTGNFVKIEQRIPVRIEFKNSRDLEKLRAGMNVEVNASKEN
jgi:membrane fusion protein (multidrug efflux system)